MNKMKALAVSSVSSSMDCRMEHYAKSILNNKANKIINNIISRRSEEKREEES